MSLSETLRSRTVQHPAMGLPLGKERRLAGGVTEAGSALPILPAACTLVRQTERPFSEDCVHNPELRIDGEEP